MQEPQQDVTTIAGPFSRESECIASLEDPISGKQTSDELSCAEKDVDSKVYPPRPQ